MSIQGAEAAKLHLKSALSYKSVFDKWGYAFGFEPSLLAGVVSRETSFAKKYLLSPTLGGELGDGGAGHGPMQIDIKSFPVWCAKWRAGLLTFDDAICMGARVLYMKYSELGSVPEALRLRASVAAYNTSAGNVRKSIRASRDVDSTTTGKDYSKDVLERAAFFKANGL